MGFLQEFDNIRFSSRADTYEMLNILYHDISKIEKAIEFAQECGCDTQHYRLFQKLYCFTRDLFSFASEVFPPKTSSSQGLSTSELSKRFIAFCEYRLKMLKDLESKKTFVTRFWQGNPESDNIAPQCIKKPQPPDIGTFRPFWLLYYRKSV